MELQSTPSYFAVIVGIIGAIALFILKREVDRILKAVDRIPSVDTFEQWGRKLDSIDPVRIESHFEKMHNLANMVGRHELRLDQHNHRIDQLEERRKEPRE